MGNKEKASRVPQVNKFQIPSIPTWLSLLVIFAAAFFLFYPSLSYYFFQDDWFVLNWVQNSNWLSLFNFRQDIIYWRPISMPIFFKLATSVFDLNPLPFHLITFSFHLLNSFLVFLLFRQLKFARIVSLSTTFLYATAAFHFIPLSWLSTTSYIIGPAFIFSSLLLFLKDKTLTSLILFSVALASSELALTLIPIAVVLVGVNRTNLKRLSPFVAIAIFYLIGRFFFLQIPQEGEYALTFAPKIFTNLFWYFTWTFNMPEAVSTVFYFNKIPQSLVNISDFWQYAIVPIVLSCFFIFLIRRVPRVIITKGLFIFLAGLSPVIFLPFHVYPMYLVIASVGVFYIVAWGFQKLKKGRISLVLIFLVIWYFSSYQNVSFTRTNHWLVNLESISRSYVSFTQNQVVSPPPKSTFIFRFPDIKYSQEKGFVIVQDEQNIRQALNNQDAMQVIYLDKSLTSLYETKDYIPEPSPEVVSFTIQPK